MQTSRPQRILRVDPQHELQSMLQHSAARLFGREVEVLLFEDHVLLTGRVSSWHDKQLAQEALRSQALPRSIRNEISVA